MISDFRMEAGFICSVKSRAKVFFFFLSFFFLQINNIFSHKTYISSKNYFYIA